MRAQKGFTLVEILIVVVILGILAAIVIPQFTNASTDAKVSSLVSDLQTMRSQIQLYKIQHNDQLPGTATGVDFATAMTQYTDVSGLNPSTTKVVATGVIYGPYLQKIPTNQFIAVTDDGAKVNPVTTTPTAGDGLSYGWVYNTITGEIRANSDTGIWPDHIKY